MKRRHCLVFFHKYTWEKRICRSRSGTKFREVENEQASQVALVVKNLPANVGDIRDMGSIHGPGRPPGGGYGNPLQNSCLEKPMDRGAWQASVHRVCPQKLRQNWSDVTCMYRKWTDSMGSWEKRPIPLFLSQVLSKMTTEIQVDLRIWEQWSPGSLSPRSA